MLVAHERGGGFEKGRFDLQIGMPVRELPNFVPELPD
jgi:hypothetical protein